MTMTDLSDPSRTPTRPDARWDAVAAREPHPDGFVFAVTTTGVYCRSGCPARTPRRDNVRFFDSPDAAEDAGFRACLRCRPRTSPSSGPDAEARARVVQACRAMDVAGGPVPPEELAVGAGWSVRQLHRRFNELTGTTPHAYGETVRAQRLRPALQSGTRVLDAAFEAGYGSVRAFYEQGAARLGMTPSAYAGGGRGERLLWAAGPLRIGGTPSTLLVVASLSGVVAVRLGDEVEPLLGEVAAELPGAELQQEDEALADVLTALRALAVGGAAPELPLDVRGTAFQAGVWAALRRIPAGEVRSYTEVAADLGRPSAVRAVARACATNPAALVTPCHRVVRSDGSLGGFRWGLAVKQALLDAERGARDPV